MKRLLLNFRKDWKIGFRTWYLWITLATVVIFYLFIRFLLPEGYQQITVYQYIDPSIGAIPLLDAVEQEPDAGELLVRVASREAVYREMEGNSSSYGLIIEPASDGAGRPNITIVSPGSAEGKWAALVELQINIGLSMGMTADMEEYPTQFRTEFLYPELRKIPYRDVFLPAFLVMESSMIGLFLLAVMLFAEKDQRMHTAYMISPGRLTEHLLSKVMVMAILGLISAFSMTLLIRGFKANYWLLFVTIVAGSYLSSAIGLVFGAIFNSLQKAMMIVIAFMLLLMLPMMSYLFPNFSPVWIRFIPTYSLLFAARDAVMPYFGSSGVYRAALLLIVEGTVLFAIARLIYERVLWSKS